MELSFHGAARAVTGSCHLIECAGQRILIDCGLFQGSRDLDEDNAAAFGFDPASIDAVILTHAHLDHCGRLPLLVKRGFTGRVVCTAATRELARLVLLDAAHLHEEDVGRRRRHGPSGQSTAEVVLYDVRDVDSTMGLTWRDVQYAERSDIGSGVVASLVDAGHILGSASVLLELSEGSRSLRVLFSGDLGSAGRQLLRTPAAPPVADVVVMESTYGDRLHRSFESSVEELYGVIAHTMQRGGNVLIPTFAIERAQEILYCLRRGIAIGRLPAGVDVFLDSPMATSATEIFRRHGECYGEEPRRLFEDGLDPFMLPNLHVVKDVAESMLLNKIAGGAVILAGSGMCAGGRIRHHLNHNLAREHCAVVFVGYAARGTLARRIVDGADHVQLFGENVAVRASIHTINGFSAHADQAGLLSWHRQTNAGKTFLVHGDGDVMRQFATGLAGTEVSLPALHERVTL